MGIAIEIDDIVLVSEDDKSDGSKKADSVTPATPPECGPSEHIKLEVCESDCSKQADLVFPTIPQEHDLSEDTKYLPKDHKFDIGILPSSSIPADTTYPQVSEGS